ncbi:SCO family protein [Miltoncostaea marina]|uniref:SCO family protein n=1 Tax=Miltoncostaea marina TaxID=2843215 RepID=UPI001C3C9082|nr:SCO family protein [Miltoncostaea marina]
MTSGQPARRPSRGGRPPMRVLLPLLALVVASGLAGALALARAGDGGSDPARTGAGPVLHAPATAGRDADGAPVRLPSPDGRPAMVTFLFTECPDVCPLVASRIAAALDAAGPAAGGIDVVAISVDPPGDTPAAVRAFLDRHGLRGRMRYMVGSRAELEPVWRAWGVAAQTDDRSGGHRESVHSAPIVFIDGDGRQVARYAAGAPYSPADLAREIRLLTA